jgi:hypothetical protein
VSLAWTGAQISALSSRRIVTAIAAVLEVDISTVVLAAARTVGLDVRTRGSDLAD